MNATTRLILTFARFDNDALQARFDWIGTQPDHRVKKTGHVKLRWAREADLILKEQIRRRKAHEDEIGRQEYSVSATHPVASYNLDGELVTAKRDDREGTWYVTSKRLGCSRSYKTPEAAIYGVCANEALTVTKITRL
jgi:hypothetical protein